MKRPLGIQRTEDPRISSNRLMKMGRLSNLRTDCLSPTRDIPGTHYCKRLSRPQAHIAAGRITIRKNPNDPIGNRTRDLPCCNEALQLTDSITF
jgi:hypothetical protein